MHHPSLPGPSRGSSHPRPGLQGPQVTDILPAGRFHTSKLKCFWAASYLPLWNAQFQALPAFGNCNNDSGDCEWRMEELAQATERLVLADSPETPRYGRWGPQNLQDVGLASPCRMLFPQVMLPQKIPTLSKGPVSGSHCRLTFHFKKS